jgi:hypothetical protein
VLIPISRGEIVNQWALWWAVTMMVVGSLVGLLGQAGAVHRRAEVAAPRFHAVPRRPDVLGHIELPLWMSFVGVPVFSVLGAWVTHAFFGVPWLLAFVSLPLIFVLTVICTNSMALTSWTPTGALSKITQFTMGAIDRANPASNLIPAGMTAEIASNAANLLSDIKPGYMLGAKPRQQAIGHVIGIFAGALTAVCRCSSCCSCRRMRADSARYRPSCRTSSRCRPRCSGKVWPTSSPRAFRACPSRALVAMAVAAAAAVVFEVLRMRTKGRFPISAVAVGLGVVLPPESCFAMWLGAMLFWWMGRKKPAPGTRDHALWVDGCEPICAGLISGAALIGIGNAIVNVLM